MATKKNRLFYFAYELLESLLLTEQRSILRGKTEDAEMPDITG